MNIMIGWYELLPGVCGYLYEIYRWKGYDRAIIALQVGDNITHHKLKIYSNKTGARYVITKWGRVYLHSFIHIQH